MKRSFACQVTLETQDTDGHATSDESTALRRVGLVDNPNGSVNHFVSRAFFASPLKWFDRYPAATREKTPVFQVLLLSDFLAPPTFLQQSDIAAKGAKKFSVTFKRLQNVTQVVRSKHATTNTDE